MENRDNEPVIPLETKARCGMVRRFFGRTFRISPAQYLLAGIVAFSLKFLLDSLLASKFHRTWGLEYYLEPSRYYSIWSLPQTEWPFYMMLVVMSLPFMVAGVVLTLGRVQDAGLPRWVTLVFFVPLVNLIAFLALTLVPTARTGNPKEGDAEIDEGPQPVIWYSGIFCALLAAGFGLAMGAVAFMVTQTYGWGLFIGIPVMQGFVAAMLYGTQPQRSSSGAVGVALLSALFTAAGILVFGLDGLICLLMALPLVLPLVAFGAWLGSLAYPATKETATYTALTAWLLMPGLLGLEAWTRPQAPLLAVTSHIEVDAVPGDVWNYVIEFSDLPPPTEPLFRTGISYPVRATIQGRGVGAVRYCDFSTGPFVEPITVWDPPRRLAFDVRAQPPPMQELTLFARPIHPPHLEEMLFVSHRGQFLLTPLEGGRTLMEGTTWYSNGMWPVNYWKPWSDWIIHKIHMRVLEHIKAEAEAHAA